MEILAAEGGMRTELSWVQTLVDTCAIISKAIVCLFLVDVILHIASFGPRHYFGNSLYVLDFFVVITTCILEFVVHPLVHSGSHGNHGGGHLRHLSPSTSAPSSHANQEEVAADAAGFVVVLLRSWRLVRLVHGLAFSEKLRHDEHLKLTHEVEEEREKELELETTGSR